MPSWAAPSAPILTPSICLQVRFLSSLRQEGDRTFMATPGWREVLGLQTFVVDLSISDHASATSELPFCLLANQITLTLRVRISERNWMVVAVVVRVHKLFVTVPPASPRRARHQPPCRRTLGNVQVRTTLGRPVRSARYASISPTVVGSHSVGSNCQTAKLPNCQHN